jgi:divinyl chlorophyllide a 8-vinyl-reductase
MSRIFLVGATGTIGRATVRALQRHGHDVVCFQRTDATPAARRADGPREATDGDVMVRLGNVTDPESIQRDGLRGERFDAVVSCLASRTGAPRDAWAIDHQAHLHLLNAAKHAGIPHMVLLSAICVQKPRLAFQHAKLAFERELMTSGLTYSIVRPTAYFKSLSGQVERVRNGKPYLMFGDGTLTSCKPISDDDLAEFMVGCLTDPARHNRVLPIGGPGAAITPLEQGEHLFALLGMEPRYRRVPVRMLDVIAGVLGALGRIIPPLAAKAEFARIGRYYATESMLVWDAVAGRYDADATPSTGHETLFDCYAQLVRGEVTAERGDHAVFSD